MLITLWKSKKSHARQYELQHLRLKRGKYLIYSYNIFCSMLSDLIKINSFQRENKIHLPMSAVVQTVQAA